MMQNMVVVVPGISTGLIHWKPLLDRLKKEPPLEGTHWLLCDHHMKALSLALPSSLAENLRAEISQECVSRGPFAQIILVGHSIGGVLLREAYLLDAEDQQSGATCPKWSNCVTKMILFASINRGIDPNRKWWIRTSSWAGNIFPPIRKLVTWHFLRGSYFITNLRIRWIRHFAALGDKAPVVIQLLGTKDDLVTREDSLDIEQFRNGYSKLIADADHATLFRLDQIPNPDGRYSLLREAFLYDKPTGTLEDPKVGPAKIVFVLHGIRADNRSWVKETKQVIAERWPEVCTITPRYEYFSALRFAIPFSRKRNLRWFQDEYSSALASNPRATFNFIGHSNGTYLFGESLRRIPGMRFERASLVGSVLPVDYNWSERVRLGQIKSLRVDGSCYDWPVAWLCQSLRALGMNDVGTGGYEGFTSTNGVIMSEFFWYTGGHSAPLASANLPNLAAFAVVGTCAGAKADQKAWFATISRSLRWLSPISLLSYLILLVFFVVNGYFRLTGIMLLLPLVAIIILDSL